MADSNQASYKLTLVRSMLDMMMNRFERHANELQKIFGGASHTDLHTLMAIDDLVGAAKSIVDEEPMEEVANA